MSYTFETRPKKLQEQLGWLDDVDLSLAHLATRICRRKKRYPELAVAVQEAAKIASELFHAHYELFHRQ